MKIGLKAMTLLDRYACVCFTKSRVFIDVCYKISFFCILNRFTLIWSAGVLYAAQHLYPFFYFPDAFLPNDTSSLALKLYIGLMRLTISTVGSTLSTMSSIVLYAIGLSSNVLWFTDVV